MAATQLPEGMTEEDYEAIHAAVVETVRGRWFLEEFARRARMGEMEQVLTAIGRLEATVLSQKALPAAEIPPHMRLFAQRADEIAARLTQIAENLRWSGADERLCEELAAQSRALAGLPKGSSEAASAVMLSVPEVPLAAVPAVLQIEAQLVEAGEMSAEAAEIAAEEAAPEAKASPGVQALAAPPVEPLEELSDAEMSALSEAEPEVLFDESCGQDAGEPDETTEIIASETVETTVPADAFEDEPPMAAPEPAAFVALGKALETELEGAEAAALPSEDSPTDDLLTAEPSINYPAGEPRLAALAAIDWLPLRERLALFG